MRIQCMLLFSPNGTFSRSFCTMRVQRASFCSLGSCTKGESHVTQSRGRPPDLRARDAHSQSQTRRSRIARCGRTHSPTSIAALSAGLSLLLPPALAAPVKSCAPALGIRGASSGGRFPLSKREPPCVCMCQFGCCAWGRTSRGGMVVGVGGGVMQASNNNGPGPPPSECA